jgi:hypothetical protein
MRLPALFAVVWAVSAGCQKHDVAANRPIGPSPLLQMDPDRLYILVHLKGLMDRDCGYYYADPTDPRYVRVAETCARWERESLDWLRANGAPDVQPEHLRSKAFWSWHQQKQEGIERCLQAAVHTADPEEAARAKQACGPIVLLDYVEIHGKEVDFNQLGIVPPKREAGQ